MDSFVDVNDLNLWTYAERSTTFYSSSTVFLLLLPLYRSLFLSYSFSPHVSLSSFFSLASWLAESLRLSWAVRTSSLRLVFYEVKFFIFCLYVSFSWLLEAIWFLISASSLLSLACWLADNLKLYWDDWNSWFRLVFSELSLFILFFRFSFYLSLSSIFFLYSLIYLIIFWFWFADNLRFSWACII